MNNICPFDCQQVNTDVFLTCLLSIERLNNIYFSFSCYDCKHSAFVHLIAQSGQIQDKSDKKAISKMIKGLSSHCVIEGKEHMSFRCYQQACKLLVEDDSPDSVFALCVLT